MPRTPGWRNAFFYLPKDTLAVLDDLKAKVPQSRLEEREFGLRSNLVAAAIRFLHAESPRGLGVDLRPVPLRLKRSPQDLGGLIDKLTAELKRHRVGKESPQPVLRLVPKHLDDREPDTSNSTS